MLGESSCVLDILVNYGILNTYNILLNLFILALF